MLAALRRTPVVRVSAYSRISSPQYQTASPPTSAPKTNRNIAVLLSRLDASQGDVEIRQSKRSATATPRGRRGNRVDDGGYPRASEHSYSVSLTRSSLLPAALVAT